MYRIRAASDTIDRMSLLHAPETEAPSRKGRFLLIVLLAMAGGAGYYLWTSPPDWLPELTSFFGESAPVERAADPPRRRAVREPEPDPEPVLAEAAPEPVPEPEPDPEPEPAPPPPSRVEPLLRVSSDVPGASVFLDRRFLGTTPFEAVELEPGPHRLNVSAEGYEGFARDIEIGDDPVSVDVRFREVRLDARVAVVHRHRFGSCSGVLRADLAGLHYETDGDDAFSIPFAELEEHAVDYLEHTLTVKRRGGRTYNFTDERDTADALFVFHRDVERARDRLADAQ